MEEMVFQNINQRPNINIFNLTFPLNCYNIFNARAKIYGIRQSHSQKRLKLILLIFLRIQRINFDFFQVFYKFKEMLQKIATSDVIRVGELLDEYINQKILNNALTVWKRLKYLSKKSKNAFSTSSFAKNSSNLDANSYMAHKSYLQKNQVKQSICKNLNHIKHRPKEHKKDNDQFEEVVLQKIRQIEHRISSLKSKQNSSLYESSSQTLRYRTQGPSYDNKTEGIRFGLNARYIPMRQKLKELEPRVYQTQGSIYPIYDGREMRKSYDTLFVQTPRIGKRKESKQVDNEEDNERSFSKSIYSLAQEYKGSKRVNPKIYYDKMCNTDKKMANLIEMGSEQRLQERERVLSEQQICKKGRKSGRICQNVECERESERYLYGPLGLCKVGVRDKNMRSVGSVHFYA